MVYFKSKNNHEKVNAENVWVREIKRTNSYAFLCCVHSDTSHYGVFNIHKPLLINIKYKCMRFCLITKRNSSRLNIYERTIVVMATSDS